MFRKLRVAMGTLYPYDESVVQGGIEAVALYLTQALADQESVELHIVSCDRKIRRDLTERRGTIIFHWLTTSQTLYGLRAATVDAWRVRRVYNTIEPDVIHAQGFSEYALASPANVPLLLAIHGIEPLVPRMLKTTHFRGAVGLYRKWIGSWVAHHSIQRAHGIISNAGGYIPAVLAQHLNGKHIYSIFNPISSDFFQLGAAESQPSRVVLWVGGISERKNLVGLIRAFGGVVRRVSDARLRIIGGVADPSYFQDVQEEIRKQSLQDRVDIVGRVAQPELLEAYTTASLLAISSMEETAPMAVAQAMAAGKPVVATSVGGIPWMVEEGVSGFLADVHDMETLANRMTEVLSDDAKRQAMGQAARARARQRFAADSVAEDTVQAYYDLLSRRE